MNLMRALGVVNNVGHCYLQDRGFDRSNHSVATMRTQIVPFSVTLM